MELTLIRNATLRLRYGGVDLLVDPMLSVKHAIRPMGDASGRNPTVDLPCPLDEVLGGVDTVFVSHLHPDHFDEAAFGVVPRDLPVLCQPGDGEKLANAGFTVTELDAPAEHRGISLTPTGGAHGTGAVLERMGRVMGLVLRAPDEPTVYWCGDTVLCDEVRDVIAREQPDVIVTHSGGASYGGTTILMDAEETIEVARLAPDATIVAVHLEAVAHAPVTRADVRAAGDAAGIEPDRLRIPADGETVTL